MTKMINIGSDCTRCTLRNGGCVGYKNDIVIRTEREVFADLGNGIAKVFEKGATLSAWGIVKDGRIYCAGADSPIVEGYSDMLNLSDLSILS